MSRLVLPLIVLASLPARGQGPALEFFEKEVRPILAHRCQECHGAAKQKGGLRLDSRSALLAGGGSGPAVELGQPEESLLIDAINYGDLVQMPPKSKLPAAEIATLTRWVALGAPWPEEEGAKSATVATEFNLQERAKHWSFQPLRDPEPPAVNDPTWPRTSIDRFLRAALEAQGLEPAPDADKRTLIRRVSFDLIGLPPSPAEVEAFVNDDSTDAYEQVVERLLASPHYGERWARHWLDLVRFAETSGHEFDYDILGAWRYRDYVIRALNADIPYDQFVVEHIAGDLLENPRRHPTEGTNESVLGTAFFTFFDGTHSPVDVREEQMRRVENQVDVFSKTFLGLTVACARCHDHKFDAISTKDYYALAGYLRSSRPVQAFLDPPERIGAKVAELVAIQSRSAVFPPLPLGEGRGEGQRFPLRDPRLKIESGIGDRESRIPPTLTPALSQGERGEENPADASTLFEDFAADTFVNWSVAGHAFGYGPSRKGDGRIEGDRLVFVAPGQAHSGLVSDRLQGVLRSKTFTIERKFIHYLASGRGGRINLVIDGFDKIRDPIYGRLMIAVDGTEPRWRTQDVSMWLGHDASIEIADGAVVDYMTGHTRYSPGDGFLAVDEVRFSDATTPPPVPRQLATGAIDLPASLLARYREVEATIPPPTLAPALADGTGLDERVHIRGNHKTLGEIVPRRFLEAIAGADQPAPSSGSGRLELARRLVALTNPLPSRVLVNRLWKHHFGEGLVRSPDDFGAMGQAPSHPELLDYLATRFIKDGWSIKRMHRLMVLSRAYRMQSVPDPESEQLDPDNRLLHRMNVRRLEPEAIRDAILAVSGRLDRTMFGPSVPPHLTPFMDGRGKPSVSGPLDGHGRRSLYINVRRNFLTPMFLAFDFPSPATTIGRRNVSNVPAQALTLLNDPFVVEQSRLWAEWLLRREAKSTDDRLASSYLTAFGRPPTETESAEALAFLGARGKHGGRTDEIQTWADFCHVLMNMKEFLFVH